MSSFNIKVKDTWKNADSIYVKADGNWRTAIESYIKINGEWKTVNIGDPISPILNENSWETIQAVTKAGLASQYWSVGQGKEIRINGTVAGVDFSGTYYAFILGFNHNSSVEGNNTIHFCIGSTAIDSNGMRAGHEVVFSGYNAWSLANKIGELCMNETNSTIGGWRDSYMRNTICKNFYSILPAELKNVIAPCAKASLTMYNSGGLFAENEYIMDTVEDDKIFLLGHKEVLGNDLPEGNITESKQEQYSYYANKMNIAKKNANIIGGYTGHSYEIGAISDVPWWLRDVAYKSNYNFLVMSSGSTNASAEGEIAYISRGFVPCFVIS